jgi:purine-binding chemotaxis protein CheW
MSNSNQAAFDESEIGEKYLTIQIADEHYGVNILRVREIIGMQDITPLPSMPEHVRGVINLRGKIIPVIDLRIRIGMQAIPYTPRTCIVVLDLFRDGEQDLDDAEMIQTGCIVDTVSEVREILESCVETPPGLHCAERTEYVNGLANLEELNLVVSLLEIDSLLSITPLELKESSSAQGAA